MKALRDITDADEKVNAVLEGIRNLGAKDDEIRLHRNESRKNFISMFEKLNEEVLLEQD